MHIPDGFLDVKTAVATGALGVSAVGIALRQLRHRLPSSKVPLLGLTAAFVFAAQMLNFPIAGGTSGHLMGGVLISSLLGPSAAIVILASVLIVQCLGFADGGLTALGANIFNMGVIGAGGGGLLYSVFRVMLERISEASKNRDINREVRALRQRVVAATVAAWFSVVLSSLACSAELAMSGVAPWASISSMMVSFHVLIGLGEAVITGLVLSSIARSQPTLMREDSASEWTRARRREFVAFGLLASLLLVLFVAPLASSSPDGLDRTAELLQFESKAQALGWFSAPLGEYRFPGIDSVAGATVLAGAIGTLVLFALATMMARKLIPDPAESKVRS